MGILTKGAPAALGLLVAAFATAPASAADLGGDCCADLEERIAELEATTARKGNRKVSLKISGFVAQQLLFFDDGDESNVYVTDTGSFSIGTHVRFSGSAQIAPGWTAGYSLNLEFVRADSLLASQDGPPVGSAFAGGGDSIAIENSYWFLKSDQLGQVSVGQQSSAADNQAILPDGSGTLVVANYVLYDSNGFRLRRFDGPAGLTDFGYGSLATCGTLNGAGGASADCDGIPYESIRYDTPTFAGFSGSVSWGQDDIWAISGRYAGEFSGFKLAAAVAYVENSDETFTGNLNAADNGGFETAAFQVGAYIENVPTGLWVYGAYGQDYNDVTAAERDGGLNSPEGENWYIKAGIRKRVFSLGHSVLFGEYGENQDKLSSELYDAGVSSSNLTQYGVGFVQEIDAAAMSLWVGWRHYDVDDITCEDAVAATSCASVGLDDGVNSFEDLDIVKAGALINF